MARELHKRGFKNVSNLEGSIFAWANAGLPLENKNGVTKKVHGYDESWGKLLNNSMPKKVD